MILKNNQKYMILLSTISFLLCQVSTSRIDSILKSSYKSDDIGVSIFITKPNKILYENHLGNSNYQTKETVSRETKFVIGSLTKQFTAAAILLLRERKKLKLDDELSLYIKDFSDSKYKIKISQLLSHTSGISSDNSNNVIKRSFDQGFEANSIVSYLSKLPFNFKPGTEYRYSNNGYILLGLVIEEITGQSFEYFISKEFFIPIDMNHSSLIRKSFIPKKLAVGYSRDDNNNMHEEKLRITTFSAGGIISTAHDMRKWVHSLFSGTIINSKSLEIMTRANIIENGQKINIGFGWELNEISSFKSYEHSGFEPGYKSASIYIPEKEIYIIIMQNSETPSPVAISVQVASLILGKPYEVRKSNFNLTIEEMMRFVGTYRFESGIERMIIKNGDRLFYKAKGGIAKRLFVATENTLRLEKGYPELKFSNKENNKYQTIDYQNRIERYSGKRISDSVDKENKEIIISLSKLKSYVGFYKNEQMAVKIFIENEMLFAQPPGSNKLQMIAKAKDKFFIKEIGAELSFSRASLNEAFDKIIILLEGQKMVLSKFD